MLLALNQADRSALEISEHRCSKGDSNSTDLRPQRERIRLSYDGDLLIQEHPRRLIAKGDVGPRCWTGISTPKRV